MALNPTCLGRLRKEYRNITKDPPPHIFAKPHPSNILKWYFIILGPSGTPYEHGIYMGRMQFTDQYPYAPPALYMITPSGRFKTNTKLCLSMSDFHPETWNPLWSVGSVLTGLLSFMVGEEETVGSMKASDAERRKLAFASHEYNKKDKIFRELFGDYIRENVVPAKASGSTDPVTDNENAEGNDKTKESMSSNIIWMLLFILVLAVSWKLMQQMGISRR
mmetsp:Transcript_19643/g.33685  ORF Transcript_19643/g.33685 Transcript_19643/m.33685 type:complete len:220 (+) Transcript_19643:100-759(+)|eukprot:CAMPEP_0184702872 /NCGR_PEP_ID=MMETSP0313-20130426/25809_1 /TAXON_ID=2792 /ORGANISM="Porphyridium aerugineum, Strain SAG 1380-2" /LENGTH=219 /DNA_ID=CAMNT_0027163487 /DNA_START=28 /DNA_END=687 /DNA_ORIENTATION=+